MSDTSHAEYIQSTKEVSFRVLLDDEIVRVFVNPQECLDVIFGYLRGHRDHAKFIPAHISYRDCTFYQVKVPELAVWDQNSDELGAKAKAACRKENNTLLIEKPGSKKIRSLTGKSFDGERIYLVIQIPHPIRDSNLAIDALKNKLGAVFDCLTIKVGHLRSWSEQDVWANLGGDLVNSDDHDLFKGILEELVKPRLYDDNAQWQQDREIALSSYGTELNHVLMPALESQCTVTSGREFVAFYNVLRCFNDDVDRIKNNTSSALKASNFVVPFIQPPFFTEDNNRRELEYQQEMSWAFPIFLYDTSKNEWRKFTPKSNWMVISQTGSKIPFIISEVISQVSHSDRNCMLVQAIALARTGQYLLKPTSEHGFFVVAIYINKDMVASRYLVRQDPRDKNRKVFIHQKDFDLADQTAQLNFLREMYNLIPMITALSLDLEEHKGASLINITGDAKGVLSLHWKSKTGKTADSSLHPVGGGAGGMDAMQDENDPFSKEEIQNLLREQKYQIDHVLRNRGVAIIVDDTKTKLGCIKFVERRTEIEILKALCAVNSEFNHTISDVQFWPVEGGTVISMPFAGEWLTSLSDPDNHLLSVARQLFEAVGFMHENKVAHMDLKPQNILIPRIGGRLSIIDFSVSIRVNNPNTKYAEVVGTKGYIAPEVLKGECKPMLADLWSCGKTLEELCKSCRPSTERTELLRIATKLMDTDPEKRPKMSDVLEWMNMKEAGSGDAPLESSQPAFATVPQTA